MSLLAYLKIGAGVLAAAIIAILWIEVKSLRIDVATKDVTIAARDQRIEALDQQKAAALGAVKSASDQVKLARTQAATGDAAAATARANLAAAQKELSEMKRKTADVAKDAPAALVLRDAADRMRKLGQKIAALRADRDPTTDPRGNENSAGAADDSWPGLNYPFSQSQFADACDALGGWLLHADINLKGIADFQAAYNVNIKAANARGERAPFIESRPSAAKGATVTP